MNTFGNKFRISIFGESHGSRIGVTLDGVLPGIPLSEKDFSEDLGRRRAGAPGTTPRTEADVPEIVSGLYQGRTTGAPLTILFRNENTRSEDYEQFRQHPAPVQVRHRLARFPLGHRLTGHAHLLRHVLLGQLSEPAKLG